MEEKKLQEGYSEEWKLRFLQLFLRNLHQQFTPAALEMRESGDEHCVTALYRVESECKTVTYSSAPFVFHLQKFSFTSTYFFSLTSTFFCFFLSCSWSPAAILHRFSQYTAQTHFFFQKNLTAKLIKILRNAHRCLSVNRAIW